MVKGRRAGKKFLAAESAPVKQFSHTLLLVSHWPELSHAAISTHKEVGN